MSAVQKALGANIAAARRQKGLKQKHLAAAVGVEITTVSRWENGVSTPPVAKLGEIAAALDVTAADLLSGVAA